MSNSKILDEGLQKLQQDYNNELQANESLNNQLNDASRVKNNLENNKLNNRQNQAEQLKKQILKDLEAQIAQLKQLKTDNQVFGDKIGNLEQQLIIEANKNLEHLLRVSQDETKQQILDNNNLKQQLDQKVQENKSREESYKQLEQKYQQLQSSNKNLEAQNTLVAELQNVIAGQENDIQKFQDLIEEELREKNNDLVDSGIKEKDREIIIINKSNIHQKIKWHYYQNGGKYDAQGNKLNISEEQRQSLAKELEQVHKLFEESQDEIDKLQVQLSKQRELEQKEQALSLTQARKIPAILDVNPNAYYRMLNALIGAYSNRQFGVLIRENFDIITDHQVAYLFQRC